MKTEKENTVPMEQRDPQQLSKPEGEPFRVRLPSFLIADEVVGLGDAIKRVTYTMGIKPCGGCEKRAAALNRRMVFSR
jgi:hypothetical protein